MWSYQRLLSRPRVQRSAISFVLLICRLYVTPPHTSPVHAKTVGIKKNLNTGIEKQQQKKKTCQIKRLIIILSLCFIFQVKLFLCQHSPQCPLDVEKNHFIFNAKLYFLKPKAQKVSAELCLLKHEYKKFHFLKKFCGPSIEQMGRMTFQSAGIISILYSLV